jgi:DNA-binding HxlR family transcriptional regulator
MRKNKFNCPAEMTISLIGGKWKVILLYVMRKNPRRFGELKRLAPGITQSILAQQLKELMESGLVERKVLGKDSLSGVEYSLTKKGESLKSIIYAMVRWGIDNQKDFVIGEFGMASFQK